MALFPYLDDKDASPEVLKILDRVTGVVFIAFGARLALESRR